MTKTKWHSKLLSLSIAFALVFSLVAMVVPVAAQAEDDLDLSVVVSTENSTYCCCDTFNVTATITNDTIGERTGDAVNVTAVLEIDGEAGYVSGPWPASGTFNVTENGGTQVVEWEVHCTGIDPSTRFTVTVDAENNTGGEVSGYTEVEQESGDLQAHIITPNSTAEIPVCSAFNLTFYIENTGCNDVTSIFADVWTVGGVKFVGEDNEHSIRTGFLDPQVLEPGEVSENYTIQLHCTSTGRTGIHVVPYGNDVCSGDEILGLSDIVEWEQVFGVSCNVTPNPTKVGYNTTFIANVGTEADTPLSYTWAFGDGNTASDTGVMSYTLTEYHTYDAPGNYTAMVQVTDNNNITVNCTGVAVVVYDELDMSCWLRDGTVAVFEQTRFMAKTDTEVCFNATRIDGFPEGITCYDGNPVAYSWFWDFGDGTNSTAQNPCHTYNVTGNYTATVTLTDDCLGNEATCNKTIEIYDELGISCNATPLETKASDDPNDEVDFHAEIIDGLPQPPASYTWKWDFDDGDSTTGCGPVADVSHQYASGGCYTAVVQFWDGTAINNTVTCNQTIFVYPALNVTCNVTPNPQNVCHAVNFTAERDGGVPGNSYNWTWSFSDNTTAGGQNVTKTFMCVGNYTGTVTITDTDLGNTANCTAEVEIIIEAPELYTPINMAQLTSKNVAFTWEDIGCCNYTLEVWQKDGLEIKVWLIDTGKDAFWTGPVFNGNWKWQVTATDACGNSAVSEIRYFQVDQPGPSVIVNSPNGGEVWAAGEIYPITWFANPTDGVIDIDYSVDGGDTWVDQASGEANDGSYLWTLPSAESDFCLVRVTVNDYASGSASDTSDNVFTITAGAPIVDITNPMGGENWMGNSSYNITWTVSGTPVMVSLSYSSDGGATWTPIASSASLSSPYTWQTPSINSDECLVKVEAEDALGSVGIDISGVFSIDSEYPDVNVESPNGGEELAAGTNTTITWSASDFWPMNGFGASQSADLDIDLYYSTDGGTTWETAIATGEENDGAYLWSIPSSIDSTNCLVKVDATDGAGNVGSDTSNGAFTIEMAPATVTSIDLAAGWNLVSLPLIPDDTTTATVMAGVSGNVSVVYYYDAAATTPVWLSWTPTGGGTLTTMEDGKGYWIYMTTAGTFTFSGNPMPMPPEVPPTYDVVAGWNMIGVKSTTPVIHSNYLVNLAGDYSVLYAYDAATGVWLSVYPMEQNGGMMEPGSGFWIYMGVDGIIIP